MDSFDTWEKWLLEQAQPYLREGRPGDWAHTLRTIHYGKALLKEEKADPEIVITTLVLHDIGWSRVNYDDFVQAPTEKKKETRSAKEHMVQGAMLARDILDPTPFPPDKKEMVLKIIAVHDEPEAVIAMQDLNAVLVMEADRLDRYGSESIRRYQAMFGEAYAAWQEVKSVRLEGLNAWFMTETAKALSRKLAHEIGLFES